MNYFGKLATTIGQVTGVAQTTPSDVTVQLKKREKIIKELSEELARIQYQNQFLTKSYEQLEQEASTSKTKQQTSNSIEQRFIDQYIEQLQQIPDQILSDIVNGVLTRINELACQQLDKTELLSFMDMDLSFKNIFRQHVMDVFESVKNETQKGSKEKQQEIARLKQYIETKSRQVDELMRQYQNKMKSMQSDFEIKLKDKMDEFQVIRMSKDSLIQELSTTSHLKMQQLQQVKNTVIKLKANEASLKLQHQRNEKKMSEQCQYSQVLESKNRELLTEIASLSKTNQQMRREVEDKQTKLVSEIMKQQQNMRLMSQNYEQEINRMKKIQSELKEQLQNIRKSLQEQVNQQSLLVLQLRQELAAKIEQSVQGQIVYKQGVIKDSEEYLLLLKENESLQQQIATCLKEIIELKQIIAQSAKHDQSEDQQGSDKVDQSQKNVEQTQQIPKVQQNEHNQRMLQLDNHIIKQYQEDLKNKSAEYQQHIIKITEELKIQRANSVEQLHNLNESHQSILNNFQIQTLEYLQTIYSLQSQLAKLTQEHAQQLQQQQQRFKTQNQQLLVSIQAYKSELAREQKARMKLEEDLELIQQMHQDYEEKTERMEWQEKEYATVKEVMIEFKKVFERSFVLQTVRQIQQQMMGLKEDNQNKKQQLLQKEQIEAYNTSKLEQSQKTIEELGKQIVNNSKAKDQLQKRVKEYHLETLNLANKIQQNEEKSKQEIQQYKTKISKKEIEYSKSAQKTNQLQQKVAHLKQKLEQQNSEQGKNEKLIHTLRREVEICKAKSQEKKNDQKDLYEKQLSKLRSEMQRVVIQNSRLLQTEKNTLRRQFIAKQQSLRQDKISLEQKYLLESKTMNDRMQALRKEHDEDQKELSNLRNQVNQQRKNTAKVSAKLSEVINDANKLDQLQIYANEMNQKMALKNEEIKKLMSNLQGFKSTMSDLQEGIMTYQSIAEQKQRQCQEIRQAMKLYNVENQTLRQRITGLQANIASLKANHALMRSESKSQQIRMSDVRNSESKKQSLLPLKRLFLKYFQAGNSYEHKIQSFNTLCEALCLSEQEMETMNAYRRIKLSHNNEEDRKEKQKGKLETLPNKLFEFLTANQ